MAVGEMPRLTASAAIEISAPEPQTARIVVDATDDTL
jgi:hypothetical protein